MPITKRRKKFETIKRLIKKVCGERLYFFIAQAYGWNFRVWTTNLVSYLSIRLRIPKARIRPTSLNFEATNICNADCVFCAYSQMERPKKVMSMDLFKRVVDQFVSLDGTNVSLTPIVGEPFVDKHLFERLDYLSSIPQIKDIAFHTNAIIMDISKSSRLFDYINKVHLNISFGGFDKESFHQVMGVDKFDAARRNTEALLAKKIELGKPLSIDILPRCPKSKCRGEFYDYLVDMREKGIVEMEEPLRSFDSWAGKIQDVDLLEAGLTPRPMPHKFGPCAYLLTTPVVLADGRVNACCCRDVEASLIIGDLEKESLADVLSGEKLKNLIHRHARSDFPEICKKCTQYNPLYTRFTPFDVS